MQFTFVWDFFNICSSWTNTVPCFYKNIPRFLTCHSQKTDAVLFIAEHYLLHEYNPDTIYALYADADPLERLPF